MLGEISYTLAFQMNESIISNYLSKTLFSVGNTK